jgi:hypothetical protein
MKHARELMEVMCYKECLKYFNVFVSLLNVARLSSVTLHCQRTRLCYSCSSNSSTIKCVARIRRKLVLLDVEGGGKTHLKLCIYGVLLEVSRNQHSRIENVKEAIKEPTRQNCVRLNNYCVYLMIL